MERFYVAKYDTGHDYGEIEFKSSHRSGSKANLEDAKTALRRKFGKRAINWRISDIFLSFYD